MKYLYKIIVNFDVNCYNILTFPLIFRDKVRGGIAASTVLIGEKI